MDAESGRVLFSDGAQTTGYPASCTKLMTMLLVLEDLRAGLYKLTDRAVASAYAAIGNDGELLRPYIVKKVVAPDGSVLSEHPEKEPLGNPIKPSTARKVREMMLGVAKKGGTARRAAVQGYSVAGKTGTAQMKEGRGYSKTAYNASFKARTPYRADMCFNAATMLS